MTINERIRYLRKELLKINQLEFANKIKLKQNSVSFLEKEGSTVTGQNIELICNAFCVSRDWLITGEGEPFSEDLPEDEYIRATTEIGIKDERAKQAIIDYWKLNDEDKTLWWDFMERFVIKKQEDH